MQHNHRTSVFFILALLASIVLLYVWYTATNTPAKVEEPTATVEYTPEFPEPTEVVTTVSGPVAEIVPGAYGLGRLTLTKTLGRDFIDVDLLPTTEFYKGDTLISASEIAVGDLVTVFILEKSESGALGAVSVRVAEVTDEESDIPGASF